MDEGGGVLSTHALPFECSAVTVPAPAVHAESQTSLVLSVATEASSWTFIEGILFFGPAAAAPLVLDERSVPVGRGLPGHACRAQVTGGRAAQVLSPPYVGRRRLGWCPTRSEPDRGRRCRRADAQCPPNWALPSSLYSRPTPRANPRSAAVSPSPISRTLIMKSTIVAQVQASQVQFGVNPADHLRGWIGPADPSAASASVRTRWTTKHPAVQRQADANAYRALGTVSRLLFSAPIGSPCRFSAGAVEAIGRNGAGPENGLPGARN